MSDPSSVMFPKQLFINCHVIDTLLGKLECSEENGVNDARAAHRNTEACNVYISMLSSVRYPVQPTSIHAGIQKLNFRSRLFVAAANKTITLVDAFGSIDWKDLHH
jgi:hypothetical protein